MCRRRFDVRAAFSPPGRGRLLRQQTGTQPGFDQLTFPDLLRSRRHGRKFRVQRTYLQGIEVEFHVAGTPLKSEAKRSGGRSGGNLLREAEPPPRKRFVRNLRLSPALRSIAVPEVELKLDAVVKVVRPGNAGVPAAVRHECAGRLCRWCTGGRLPGRTPE